MTTCPSLTGLTASTAIITKDLVDDLIVSTYSRTVGTSVNVRCRDDFGLSLVGPSTVKCQANGAWSGSPYCTAIPVVGTTSTNTNTNNTGLDDQKILIIVLVVVGVVVAALILFVCIAMFWGMKRHKRQKRYKHDDDDSSVTYSTHRDIHLQKYPSHVTPAFNPRQYDYYQPRYPTTHMEERKVKYADQEWPHPADKASTHSQDYQFQDGHKQQTKVRTRGVTDMEHSVAEQFAAGGLNQVQEPRWFDDPYYTQRPPSRVIPMRPSYQPRDFGSIRQSRSMDNVYDDSRRRMAEEDYYHDRLPMENVRIERDRR